MKSNSYINVENNIDTERGSKKLSSKCFLISLDPIFLGFSQQTIWGHSIAPFRLWAWAMGWRELRKLDARSNYIHNWFSSSMEGYQRWWRNMENIWWIYDDHWSSCLPLFETQVPFASKIDKNALSTRLSKLPRCSSPRSRGSMGQSSSHIDLFQIQQVKLQDELWWVRKLCPIGPAGLARGTSAKGISCQETRP